MLYYWGLFLIPAFFALIGKRRDVNNNSAYTISLDSVWWMIVFILVIIIGLREQVGGDWFTYLLEYDSPSSSQQTSYLLLRADSVYFDRYGRYSEPYMIERQGYLSWEGVGDQLPFDYNIEKK